MFTKAGFAHAGFGMLNIALPLLIGILLHNYWLGVMGALGTLLFMYYVPSNGPKTFTQMVFIVIIGLVSFPISALVSTTPWLSLLWIGFLAYCVQYILTCNKFVGPGAFFIMIINGMLASLHHYPLHHVLQLAIFAYLGILTSLFFSILEPLIMHEEQFTLKLYFNFQTADLQITTKSLIYGIFAFIANFIGYGLNLPNYYWVLIGAVAVLQAENIIHARQRQIQYISGSIVGCILSLVAYVYIQDRIVLACLAVLCIGTICLTISHNYLIGNFFTTPVALLLLKCAMPALPDSLVGFRIFALILGTIIGLLGILYFDHLMKKQTVTTMLTDSLD